MRRFACLFFLFLALAAFGQKKNGKKKTTDDGKHRFLREHTPHARDFHAIGHSLFFDLSLAPLKSYQEIKNFDTTNEFSRLASYSFYHLSYFLRLNVLQPADDKAVTLTLNPGVGLGMSESKKVKGMGIFTGALLAGYEWGAGSTYRASDEKGGFFRLGAEYFYTPLLTFSKSTNEKDVRSWINPIVSFGFRKENKKEKLVETNFKFGWGLSKENDFNASGQFAFLRPFTFRASLVFFLDH